jgi:hypothetical protein
VGLKARLNANPKFFDIDKSDWIVCKNARSKKIIKILRGLRKKTKAMRKTTHRLPSKFLFATMNISFS